MYSVKKITQNKLEKENEENDSIVVVVILYILLKYNSLVNLKGAKNYT